MVLCALALAMIGCSKKEEPAAEEPAAEAEAATAVEALTSGDTEGAVDAAKDGVSEAVEDLKEGVSDADSALVEGAAEQRGDTRGLFPSRGWAFLCGGTPPGNCGNFRINRLYFVFSANIYMCFTNLCHERQSLRIY